MAKSIRSLGRACETALASPHGDRYTPPGECPCHFVHASEVHPPRDAVCRCVHHGTTCSGHLASTHRQRACRDIPVRFSCRRSLRRSEHEHVKRSGACVGNLTPNCVAQYYNSRQRRDAWRWSEHLTGRRGVWHLCRTYSPADLRWHRRPTIHRVLCTTIISQCCTLWRLGLLAGSVHETNGPDSLWRRQRRYSVPNSDGSWCDEQHLPERRPVVQLRV